MAIVKRQLLRGVVNRIALVGIELEGGWNDVVQRDGAFIHTPSNLRIIRDGSVEFAPQQFRSVTDPNSGLRKNVPIGTAPPKAIGEIVSYPPMAPDKTSEWIKLTYPPMVNTTCGLHVHMSFHHRLNYSRLMTVEYMNQLISELRKWGEAKKVKEQRFWDRLNPDNPWTQQHCAHQFLADGQVTVKEKNFRSRGTPQSRYTFINYCAAQHNTVECRGLTMFDKVDTAISAVECVLDTTNRFLSKIRQRERTLPIQIKEKPIRYEEIGTIARY